MPEDDPLAGIGEDLEAVEDEGDAASDDGESGRDDDPAEPEADTEPASGGAHRDPAFEFSPDMQRPVYPRQETWDAWEDARDFEVQRQLRGDDVRDVAKREIHDAVFRLAAQRPELVADLVMEARGIDIDDE